MKNKPLTIDKVATKHKKKAIEVKYVVRAKDTL